MLNRPTRIIFLTFCFFCNLSFSLQVETNINKVQIDSLDYYYNSAYNELELFDTKASINSARKGLDLANKLGDNHRVSLFYNVIGHNLDYTGDIIKSRQYHLKALEYAEKSGNNDALAKANIGVGNTYIQGYENELNVSEELNLGLEYYNTALIYAKKDNNSELILTATLNIGWTYIDAKLYDRAYPFLIEAKGIIYSKLKENLAHVQINYLFAKYYKSKNNISKVKFHLDEALRYDDDYNNARELKEIHFMYSKLYQDEGNFKKALEHYKKYYEYQQKIYDADQLIEKEKANSKFELDEYKRDINSVKTINEAQRLVVERTKQTLIASLGGLVVLLMFLINFYRNNKYRANIIEVLKQKNEDLKKSKLETEILSKQKAQYLSTVSHEIRTPLYGLIGLTTLLEDEHPELKDSKNLKALGFSANHLLELINDVLQINKMDASDVKLESIPFNIHTLFNNVVNSIQVFIDKNNNECIVDIDNKIPFLIGDSIRLSQILLNLVSNAAKFTKNGRIHLSATLLNKEDNSCELLIKVKDNGIGIPLEKQPFIFEKFVQIKGEVDYFQGTGLGLPIVKGLLELFNSEIVFSSEEGKGSEFSFKIVLKSSKEDSFKTEDKHISYSEIVPSNYKLLVVEDNEINQIVTRKVLEKEGYNCDVSNNGFEAVEAVATKKYDLVLMDINMPKMSGIEATKKIMETHPDTVILALTASDDLKLKDDILESGMRDVILKPYDLQKFYQIILKNLIKK